MHSEYQIKLKILIDDQLMDNFDFFLNMIDRYCYRVIEHFFY